MTTLELDSFTLGIWKKEFYVSSLGDGVKTVDFLHQRSSKCGLGIPVSPQDLLRGPWGQKYFYYKTEKLFAFLTFFHEHTTEFSRDNVTCGITTDWMQSIYKNPPIFSYIRN